MPQAGQANRRARSANRARRGAELIDDVREHAPCVQIDAGIECVRLLVEAHGYLLEKDEPS